MNYYTDLRLDEIGIASQEEAEELEFELELRFQDFTAKDRKTWQQQNDYLDHFARTGTLSSSARKGGRHRLHRPEMEVRQRARLHAQA